MESEGSVGSASECLREGGLCVGGTRRGGEEGETESLSGTCG